METTRCPGQPLANVFHIINQVNRQRCENPVDKVIRTGGNCRVGQSYRPYFRDGTERIIADSGAPIKDENGNISGVVLVFVTRRKSIRPRTVPKGTRQGRQVSGPRRRGDGWRLERRKSFNDQPERLRDPGYSQEEILGKNCSIISSPPPSAEPVRPSFVN